MVSVVFIDVPPTLDPAAVVTMVARCEQALGAGRCRRWGDVSEAPGNRYYALLQTEDTRLQTTTVELHRFTAEGEIVARRDLTFSEHDPPQSRWAAMGLVIAGLIAARDADAAAPRDAGARPQPPRLAEHVRVRDESAFWGVDVGGVAGLGLAKGPYRFGAFGRFWHRLGPGPHLLLLGSVRYAASSGDLDARWMSIGAGLGVRLGKQRSPINLDVAGELIAERMAVTTRLGTLETTDSAARARFGCRINLSLSVTLTSFAGLVLGVDGTALTPPVRVEVQNQEVGREPSARGALTAGLRVAL